MLGIALGVAALIIVLSVMNGFQKEVRDRMLAVVSHIELTTPTGDAFSDVDAVINKVRQHPEVLARTSGCCRTLLITASTSEKASPVGVVSSIWETTASMRSRTSF